MHIVCSYTSGYFSIYDDEYAYTMMMIIIMSCMIFEDLRLTTSPTMMGSRGCEPPGNSRSHMWVVCREVLHIQFCPDWRSFL